MSLGLCICESCENEENFMKKYSQKLSTHQYDHNCKICYIDELHQKKISSEMKTRETFYN